MHWARGRAARWVHEIDCGSRIAHWEIAGGGRSKKYSCHSDYARSNISHLRCFFSRKDCRERSYIYNLHCMSTCKTGGQADWAVFKHRVICWNIKLMAEIILWNPLRIVVGWLVTLNKPRLNMDPPGMLNMCWKLIK